MSAQPDALPIAAPARRSHAAAHTPQAAWGRAWGTALLEIRLNLSGPGPWIMAVVLAIFGVATVWMATDNASFPVAWILSQKIGPLVSVLLLFLAASLAHRPQRYDLTELLDSKVVAGEELIFGRWLGMMTAILIPVALEYVAAMIGQAAHSKSPVEPLVYLTSLGRLLPPILFFCTLAFCLVTITRVLVLGAGLAGLIWFGLHFGDEILPTPLRIDLSQNNGVFLGLTMLSLLVMLLGYRGTRREKRATISYVLGYSAAAVAVWTFMHAGWLGLALPGRDRALAEYNRLRGPRVERRDKEQPLPNLAWDRPDGHRISLAGLRGKPLLLFFFEPDTPSAIPILKRMAALEGEFAAEGLRVLPVCLSEDLNAGQHATEAAGVRLTAVTDWGKPSASFDTHHPTSIASWALKLGGMPATMLLDDKGVLLKDGLALDADNWPTTRANIRSLLHGEQLPETPSQMPGAEMLQ